MEQNLTNRIVLSLLLLTSCVTVTKQEIDAVLFLHEQLPADFCQQHPEISKIGVYRILTCTDRLREVGICQPGWTTVRERIAYCKPQVMNYFAVKDSELEAILKHARIK